jgi:hypothetical protein
MTGVMPDAPTLVAVPARSRRPVLRVFVPHQGPLRAQAVWAVEALMVRAEVPRWELAEAADDADLAFAHEPSAWQFVWDAAPDARADALAFSFWWLARVEELLAPRDAHDEHGRFTHASSALARIGDPLATPVDDLARDLDIDERFREAGEPGWAIVPTHDIDLTWRWTRRGVRRGAKAAVRALQAGRIGEAVAAFAALIAVPYWRLRRDDPWNNAQRIRRLEWSLGARSTSYVLTDFHVPADGDPDMHERGRDRYIASLVEGTRRRRRGSATGSGTIGLHGSYTMSTTPGGIARERRMLEKLAGGEVRDHRYHYLRHRPTDAWPELDAAGITSDATLGYAEQPGFRAGTAHPFRAWHHEEGRTLDLVVIPLAFMDASLAERYLDLDPRSDGADLAVATLDAIERVGGSASVLFHNDRLCTVDTGSWTRLYRRLLTRTRTRGGIAHTAREAAIGYRTAIPAWRLEP